MVSEIAIPNQGIIYIILNQTTLDIWYDSETKSVSFSYMIKPKINIHIPFDKDKAKTEIDSWIIGLKMFLTL